MKLHQIEPFNMIGITVTTDNNNHAKLNKDMQALWERFMTENIIDQIPSKIDHTVYCVYTDYEGDHTKPYLAFLGCKVNNLGTVPPGLTAKSFKGGTYIKYTAKGNILKGIIFEKWTQIWSTDIPRAYTADFEVYGEKARNLEDAEVDIFIAINK